MFTWLEKLGKTTENTQYKKVKVPGACVKAKAKTATKNIMKQKQRKNKDRKADKNSNAEKN